mgnify:CR=1 FL=1
MFVVVNFINYTFEQFMVMLFMENHIWFALNLHSIKNSQILLECLYPPFLTTAPLIIHVNSLDNNFAYLLHLSITFINEIKTLDL